VFRCNPASRRYFPECRFALLQDLRIDLAGPRVERFPGAGASLPPSDHAARHADSEFDPGHPWHPFDNEADFLLARFMVEFGISEDAMDHLLKTLLPSLGVQHAVRFVYTVKKRIDEMRDGLGHRSWHRQLTGLRWNDAHPEPIEFYSRDNYCALRAVATAAARL
jgi:hypothetical protein